MIISLITLMKKSLLLSFFLPPSNGGIQNYFDHLSKYLPSKDIVWMAEPQAKDTEFDKNQSFKIYRKSYKSWLRIFKLTSLSLYFKVKSIARKENIKCLLLGHAFPLGLTALMIKKNLGIPYVLFTHGLEILEIEAKYPKKISFLKRILQGAKYIVVTTDYMQDYLYKYINNKDKFIKIPPGVDSSKFRLGLDKTDLISEYNLTGKKVLLTVGRLVPRKNHLAIISLLPKLLKTNPDLAYLIVGDGPMKDELEHKARDLGVAEAVIFTGSVSDDQLPNYYNLADVFVMTSKTIAKEGDVEGFGIVYLEAAASGVPSIAGSSGGASEAVLDNITGLIVNDNDPKELFTSISNLLSDDKLRTTLGNNARERAIKDFNWRDLTARLSNKL